MGHKAEGGKGREDGARSFSIHFSLSLAKSQKAGARERETEPSTVKHKSSIENNDEENGREKEREEKHMIYFHLFSIAS